MSFSIATPDHIAPAADGLHGILSQIADIDKEIGTLSQSLDALKDRRSHLEKLAVEEMTTQRLDRVGVAGRSWRVEYDHHCGVTEAKKKAFMEAAEKAGIAGAVMMISVPKLKATLKEMGTAAGKAPSALFSEGTVFEGLVGEYVAPRLRYVTTG